MSFAGAFAGAWLAAWAGCEGWSWLVPLRVDPGPKFIARRTARMVGRIVITLAVVAAGLWWFGGTPRAWDRARSWAGSSRRGGRRSSSGGPGADAGDKAMKR